MQLFQQHTGEDGTAEGRKDHRFFWADCQLYTMIQTHVCAAIVTESCHVLSADSSKGMDPDTADASPVDELQAC